MDIRLSDFVVHNMLQENVISLELRLTLCDDPLPHL